MKAVLVTSVVLATDVHALDRDLAIGAAELAESHFRALMTADPAIRGARLRRVAVLQGSFDALPVEERVAVGYGELAAAVAGTG